MTTKLLAAFALCLVLVSCKKAQENTTIETNLEVQEITEADIAKLKYTDYILDSKTADALVGWANYDQLQEIINTIKKGDLSYFNDNAKATETLFKDLKKNIPSTMKTDAILVRITAFETQFYKLGDAAALSTTSKKQLLANIKDTLIAFSNLKLQMNKKIEADTYNKITRP